MIKDLAWEKSRGKKMIEVLIAEGDIRVWIPLMATSAYIVTKDHELTKIREVKVTNIKK